MVSAIMAARSRSPRSKQSSTRFRAFVFTWNNPGDDAESLLESELLPQCKYMVYGKEVGESGTPHLQGYAQLKKQTAVSKLPKFPWHTEAAKGTPEQASEYCKKDGEFKEFGELSTVTKGGLMEKERWAAALALAESGRMEELKESEPKLYVTHYTSWQRIRKDWAPRPDDADSTTGLWIYGVSGCGKSRSARQAANNLQVPYYTKNCNKWWDNYQGEPIVIVDDVDTSHKLLGHHFKIWADRYAFNAEIKGSSVSIRPKCIIVTSQYMIEDIWEDEATREALKRRYRVVHLLTYDPNLALFL